MDTKLANELIPLTADALSAGPVLGLVSIAVFILFALVWAIHVKIEDAGIVDFFWGGGFALIAWSAIVLSGGATPVALLLAGLTTLWAVRLTLHMVTRHRHMGGEDARYNAMRRRGGPDFWWRSLFSIYAVQAAIQLIVATPLLAAILSPAPVAPVLTVGLGVGLFVVGLAVEAVADRQLWRFKARPENRGRLMTEGLFRYSRHPNYFGEILLWWGLGAIGLAASGAYWALVGPAILTLLLIRVSGVALLDAHLEASKPGYAAWAARTSPLIPLPPRRRVDVGEPAE